MTSYWVPDLPVTMTDPLQLSALEQAAAIRQGALSSEELTRFYLGRIESYSPSSLVRFGFAGAEVNFFHAKS